jgi:hypothetical protein
VVAPMGRSNLTLRLRGGDNGVISARVRDFCR